jgi:hypothetical protein
MNELIELLTNMGKVTWFCNAVSLLVLYRLNKGLSSKNSNLLTLIIIVVFNTLMMGYRGIMDWYMAANPGFSMAVIFFWCIGFASFDFAAIRAIYIAHKKENVRIGRLGHYAGFAFFAAATLQILRYLEIVLFNTDEDTAALYTVGIPSLNIATAIVCFGVALITSYRVYLEKYRRGQK